MAAAYLSAMKPTVVVDAHNHVIPESVVARLRDAGNALGARVEGDRVTFAGGRGHPLEREMWDPEAKLRALAERGIDAAAVSPAPLLVGCGLPAEAAAQACRVMNEGVAAYVRAKPDRLWPVACAPIQDTRLALAELERVDARGLEVPAWSGGRPLGDPELRPFWREVEARGMLVFVHPHAPRPQAGMDRHYTTNLVGNPVETTLAMADICLSGLLDDCPGLRFLLAHAGGFGPYQVGRWRHGYEMRTDVSASSRRPPTGYLDAFHYDTITHDDAALTYLIGRCGADHVLLGSDFPYDMADPDPVGRIGRQALSAADREAIAGGNARRLLGVG